MSQLTNPFYPPGDTLDPEERQLANRSFLTEREDTPAGLAELTELTGHEGRVVDPRLRVNVGGVTLDNPLMVAAGWDKFGESVAGLYHLGFGAVEVGSIQRDPQPGNPKPRHFVLAPGVYLNRYGFNTPGAAAVGENLVKYRNSNVPLGINIGKNKNVSLDDAPQAHADVAKLLYDLATYFVINVSSPNTVGLRDQQAKGVLTEIAKAVREVITEAERPKSVFVKIAPELTFDQTADVIEVVRATGIDGIIATNSSGNNDLKGKYGEQWKGEIGGLSGDDPDFRRISTDLVRFIYKESGDKVPVIGVGGIQDTATALEKIQAGASAIQVMTALNFQGPSLPGDINAGLLEFMEREGVRSIAELVGTEA